MPEVVIYFQSAYAGFVFYILVNVKQVNYVKHKMTIIDKIETSIQFRT